MYLEKTFDRLGNWFTSAWDWICDNSEILIFILAFAIIFGGLFLIVAYASGAFFDEVENYDFTAVVIDKDHYTTQYVTYVNKMPVVHIQHHYVIQWEDGDVRESFEIGVNHYNQIAAGDFINVHCSIREDKQGELHNYYSFKGY